MISKGELQIDCTDDGTGPAVVLVHSSVSGNRQWRALIDLLKPNYRVLAINMYGYGETSPWPSTQTQTVAAQAELVLAACEKTQGPVHLVGHSYGGSVALKAAALLGTGVSRLVLLEPTLFDLLRQDGRTAAYEESRALRNFIKLHGGSGDWARVAERFADYWVGPGSLAAMPEKRRNAFIESIPPNFYEWDGLDAETTSVAAWHELPAKVLVMCARDTKRSIREIVELLRERCWTWSFAEIPEGSHMAPLTRPELVNPIIKSFLDAA